MKLDFAYQKPKSRVLRAVEVCQLLYKCTIREQRKASRIPVIGLLKTMTKTLVLVVFFYLMFYVIGIRSSPIRGDFILYLMTGILGYINHLAGFTAAASAPSPSSPLMQHQPMTSFIALTSGLLSSLYTIAISTIIIMFFYHHFINEFRILHTVAFATMMGLACISGFCVGLMFYGMTPFSPTFVGILKQGYQRVSMIASGKMFVANTLPDAFISYFDWHPLFHINDQARGFAFNNYFPHKTELDYPIIVMMVTFTLGMVLLFVAKQRASLSWDGRKI